VQDGTLLPKVDLETGGTDPALAAVGRKFVKAHWSMGSIGLGPMLFIFLDKALKRWDVIPWGFSMSAIGMIWLAVYLMIFLMLRRRVIFTTYADPPKEARRKRNRNIRGALYPLSIAALVTALYFLFTDLTTFQTVAVSVVLFLAAAGMIVISLWQYRERPTITMTPGADGWVKMAGAHPDALRYLEDRGNTQPETP
jgi:hypothetical protein